MLNWVRSIASRFTREGRYPAASRVSQSSRTLAGVTVTADTAIQVAAVWACLRYLSQTVAVLPWHVMKNGDRGAEIQSRHINDWLISKRPNQEWSSFQFRETLTHWALRYGNGYAEIEPDQIDRPYALWPIHPDRVDPCRAQEDLTSTAGDLIAAGDLYYEVSNGTGPKTIFAAKRMFHIRGFGEGPVGVNVIQYAAQSIGWARAAQLFGGAFFGNGAHVSSVIINKSNIGPEGLALQKAEFEQIYGGLRNAHKTAHLGGDGDVKRLGLNAEETQLIEVHQFLVEEICRWFGVPPHKVMHLLRATFSNIEHQAIEVVVDSVSPWVKRFEDEADFKLFGQNRSGLYTKMNMRALMRGDSKTRGEYYKLMREVGAYSANRILELEDENTIGPKGDKYTMNASYTTLEKIGEEPPPKPRPAPIETEESEEDHPNDAAAHAAVDSIQAILEPVPVP